MLASRGQVQISKEPAEEPGGRKRFRVLWGCGVARGSEHLGAV